VSDRELRASQRVLVYVTNNEEPRVPEALMPINAGTPGSQVVDLLRSDIFLSRLRMETG
jgi:hypothetical protein